MTNKKGAPVGFFFWPYGGLNNDYLTRLKSPGIFPADWTGIPGSNASLETQWIQWRSITLNIIHSVLWPAWDPYSHQWTGNSRQSMRQLTQTDFALLGHLQQQKPMLLDRQINSSVPGRSTHRELFHLEDQDGSNFGTYFNEYDSDFPPLLLKRLPQLVIAGFAKSHTTSLQIKRVLERPRAYQTALLLGHNGYFYLPASSADTPSMCSGHCLEGLLALGGVMEHFLLNKEKIALSSWNALEQYAADIGDRRVMAGVHYPSDSLCSWLITMRLAGQLYSLPAVKQKLWSAIQRSAIFQAMKGWMKRGKGEIYAPAFKALEDAAK